MSDVFKHFEECPGVTNGDRLLGDEISTKLETIGHRFPTSGSFREIYSTLSSEIHNADILKNDNGSVIVPFDLPHAQKRFWIRFLIARGESVIIQGANGLFRLPKPHEINTPLPSPPSSEEKQRKKPRKQI